MESGLEYISRWIPATTISSLKHIDPLHRDFSKGGPGASSICCTQGLLPGLVFPGSSLNFWILTIKGKGSSNLHLKAFLWILRYIKIYHWPRLSPSPLIGVHEVLFATLPRARHIDARWVPKNRYRQKVWGFFCLFVCSFCSFSGMDFFWNAEINATLVSLL